MTAKKKVQPRRARGKADTCKPSTGATGIVTPPHLSEAEAEEFKRRAHVYAQRAYDTALGYFESYNNDPLALSRLPVVYDAAQPGDFHMVVTLTGVVNEAVSGAEAREAVADAELLARTLEHPKCTEAFTDALGAILTEHIFDGSDVSWTTPAVLRIALPLALLIQRKHRDAKGMTPTEILVTLSDTLVSREVAEEVRRSLGKGASLDR